MRSARALRRSDVILSSFVVGTLVAGLILAMAASARTTSRAHATPSRMSKGSKIAPFATRRDSTPSVTLYDQYDNPASFSTSSQNYEEILNLYDDELADDFVIPAGLGWNIDTVEVGGEYFNGPALRPPST
jgi:hypothetical protein